MFSKKYPKRGDQEKGDGRQCAWVWLRQKLLVDKTPSSTSAGPHLSHAPWFGATEQNHLLRDLPGGRTWEGNPGGHGGAEHCTTVLPQAA